MGLGIDEESTQITRTQHFIIATSDFLNISDEAYIIFFEPRILNKT